MDGSGDGMKIGRVKLLSRALRRVALQWIVAAERRHSTGPQLFCMPNDLIGAEIIVSGGFEAEHVAYIREEVRRHIAGLSLAAGERTVALDIGANIGSHAVAFAGFVDRVLCFEPNPAVNLVCRANVIQNGASGVTVHDVALSDSDGTTTLYVPGLDGLGRNESINLGESSLTKRPRVVAREVAVEIRRGDGFLAGKIAAGERVVLIKIDVEGHEMQVFQGLAETIRRHAPVIAFEAQTTAEAVGCADLLRGLGYDTFTGIHRAWARSRDNTLAKLIAVGQGRTGLDAEPLDPAREDYHELILATSTRSLSSVHGG